MAGGARILVVEDDRITATVVSAHLRELGYTVVGTADSAAGAESQVARLSPDLVLMDVALNGDDDGIAAAHAIRARWRVPVVFVTGHADRSTLERIQASEPFGVVIKPFAPAELGTAIDIAMQRRRLAEGSERRDRLYQTLFEQLPVVALSADVPDPWNLQLVSPRIAAITGIAAERWVRDPDFVRSRIHPDDLPNVAAAVERMVKDGTPLEGLELRLRASDGTPRWLSVDAGPVRDHAGTTLGWAGIATDITERRRIEQAISAQSRDAAVGRMAAVVAHEVNNPLAAIKARLHLMAADHPADGTTGRSIEVIAQQVDRIARTVRNLLTFARPRSGADRPAGQPPAPVSAEEVVRAVAALYEPRCRALNIALEVSVTPGLPALRADGDRLQQALVNLTENACEALAPRGGGRIRRAVAPHGDGVEIVVEDDGPGLGPDPERLFAPFVTTKTSGTGLGLTIARAIADEHGGSLGGGSVGGPGGGARFVLRLPAGRP